VHPFVLVLFPVVLFAVLSFVEFQQRNILRLIAFSEIFLMPYAIVSVFM
jgi:NADH:ubiquinone oxidoreductase subunit 4 (subunit M)